MKKSLVIGAAVLSLGISSIVSYADTAKTPNIIPENKNTNFSTEDREAWFKERNEYRKGEIKNALEKGLITEKEADAWEEHFDYMEKFHSENGLVPGGCHGNGFGRGMGMMGRSR
ncbi:hypothetical protein [Tissierella praeacuta]|uniref:hypothetical protein n=1 Tax=Tissierella praeacuta TaxID=43131 RepID=UPI003340CAB9